MNEGNGQPQGKPPEEKSSDTHHPVPVIYAEESYVTGPKGTEQSDNSKSLQDVTYWSRFKKWISTATAAEVGMFLLTLTIAGSSIYYTIYAKRQWRVMRESNEINRKSLYSIQRPFIIHKASDPITTVVTNPRGKETVALEYITQWENVGNTPAVGVLSMVGAVEQDTEITEQEFVGVPYILFTPKTISALGPKASTGSQTLHETKDFATEKPGVPRFFWGWMIYRDTFPNTKVHITEFCWKATKIEMLDDGQYDFEGTDCAHHNCVDEFCEDYQSIIGLSPYN